VVVVGEMQQGIAITEGSQSVVTSEPTPATGELVTESRDGGLEPIVSPPNLEPAGESGVQPASNQEPLAESSLPTPAPVVSETTGADASVLTKQLVDGPEMPEEVDPPGDGPTTDPLPAGEEAGLPSEPAEGIAGQTPDKTPVLPGTDADPDAEPPMEEDGSESVEEPVAKPEPPVEPAPVAEPEPAPEEEENIFEELDNKSSDGGTASQEVMPDENAEPFGGTSDDGLAPLPDESESVPSEPDPFENPESVDDVLEEASAESDEEMVEDPLTADDPLAEPGPLADPAEPTELDDPAEPEPAENDSVVADEDSLPEPAEESSGDEASAELPVPASDDPFAAGEPQRRWIDSTGTASLVAKLIEVGVDGRLVLESHGRRLAVPSENLSQRDRDYVAQAVVRLAKSRSRDAGDTAAAPAAPASTETAGL
jgi:hypothetical protein